MRFFKIFLVAFLSLVGAIGGIVGVMYLTGYFNQSIVEPESIHFEYSDNLNEYNLSENGHITIGTSTENVTVKKITLSLANQQADEENGVMYITDGIIKVPMYVNIGQAFLVELCKEANEEIDNEEWVVGGTSVLTAKSQSFKASQISTSINVDVPVKSIEVVTYANDTYSQLQTEFAAGETFYAKANFLPEKSLYKFGQDGTNGKPVKMKQVYFDAISGGSSGVIVENQIINDNLASLGINNVVAYNALSATDELSINAYSFLSANLEDKYVENAEGDIEQILADLKNSNVSISAKKEVVVENLVISSFKVTETTTKKSLTYNSINQIFANSGNSSSSLNFGITISDSNSSSPKLQNKIKNVGIEVYFKTGSTYQKADQSYFVMVDNLGAVITPTADGLYLPNVVEADINKSFWNFVPLQASQDYAFVLYILNDDLTIDISVNPIDTSKPGSLQTWVSTQVVDSTVSWTNESDITLTVVDDVQEANIQSEEFDLSTILSFNPGTYTVVRYIAYSEGSEADLSGLLKTCQLSTKYSTTQLGLPENTYIFELSSPILKLSPSPITDFKVKAVVLVSDYLGRLSGTSYNIYSLTNPITINAKKTVKELSASIDVSNAEVLKNINAPANADGSLDRLAYVIGTNENIFDIVFTVKADDQPSLEREVGIFLNDFEEGNIAITIGGLIGEQKMVVTSTQGVGAYISETEWQYRISYFAGSANKDTELWFYYTYNYTTTSSYVEQIKTVTFDTQKDPNLGGVVFSENVSVAIIEMYDGKVSTLEFKHDNTEETPIQQVTEISGQTLVGVRGDNKEVYFAENVMRTYYSDTNEVLTELTDEITGNFIVVAKDKFGNLVPDASYHYQPMMKQDQTGSKTYTYYYLTTTNYSNVLTQAPSDELYFIDSKTQVSVTTGVNYGHIELGAWKTDMIENGFTYFSNEVVKNEITIERYGTKGGFVQITGQEGLLSVVYASQGIGEEAATSYFELCNVLKYDFISSLAAYEGLLSYNENTGTLSILRTVGTEVSLLISVTSDLGISYELKLVIKPNISMSVQRISAQAGLLETSIIDSKQHFQVYSDNDVRFALNITFHLVEETHIYLSKGIFEGGAGEINFTPTFTGASTTCVVEQVIVMHFTKSQLAQQTVNISADEFSTALSFVQEVNFMVYPNVKFANDLKTMQKQILVQDFNTYYDIITLEDVVRVIGAETLELSDLVIAFSKTTDGLFQDRVYSGNSSTPLAQNIFVWNDFDKKIQCSSMMQGDYNIAGEYTAYLTVKYGQEVIGEIKLSISSAVQPNTESEDFEKRFAVYNNEIYLVLNRGEEITTSYIKSIFKNVEGVSFVVDGTLITENDSTTFTVKNDNITDYTLASSRNITLTLSHVTQDAQSNEITIAQIKFPILIAPIEAQFVKYYTDPPFNGASLGISDITNLNDYTQLYANNVYDEYKSGESINLFQLNGRAYGLSEKAHKAIKDSTYSYEILLEGENGQITNMAYAGQFNKDNGTLLTLPSSQDQFVYFVVYGDPSKSSIVALYRIKIIANSTINVYYPYASGYVNTQDSVMAEYVYETAFGTTTIDFSEKIGKTLPNTGHKRIQLDVMNALSGLYEETTQNYQTEYALYKVDNLMAENNLATIKLTYGIEISGSVLTIFNPGQESRNFDIVVKATVKQATTVMGETYYTIRLNSDEKDLYSLKLGGNEYNETSAIVLKTENQTYNYGQVQLYKTEGNISRPATDASLYGHYYISGIDDVTEFIGEAEKQLALTDNAVSDKVVTFVYYTIHGVIHTVNVTFVSDYGITLNEASGVTFNAGTNVYEVYADKEISLKTAFTISKANNPIDLTDIEFEYTDNGVNHIGDEILFTQIKEEKVRHTIKAIAKLASSDIGVTEDYQFQFEIDVLRSISSDFSDDAMQLSDTAIIYDKAYQTTGYIFDKLLFDGIFVAPPEDGESTGTETNDDVTEGEENTGEENTGEENTDEEAATPIDPIIYLFNAVNPEVLDGYKLVARISSNAEGFVSFDTTSVSTKTFDDVLAIATSFPIYFLKSPGQDPLNVTITFELVKEYESVSSSIIGKLEFVLMPDILVSFVYPQANDSSNLTKETIYLENRYYSGSLDTKAFDFAGEGAGYFQTTRVVLVDVNENVIDTTRLQIVATSMDKNLVFNGNESATIDYSETFNIAWNMGADFQGTLTSVVKFEVLVDGISCGTYEAEFTNNINDVFALNMANNLYGGLSENNIENPERFYVDSKATELIFSHKTALFSFKSRAQSEAKTLIAYALDETSAKAELGRITIGTTSADYNWVWKNDKYEINEDLSNVIIQVEGDSKTDYTLTTNYTDTLNAYNIGNFFNIGATLSYRIAVSYMGIELSYENLKSVLKIAGTATVDAFKLNREKATNDVAEFSISNATLATKYYYEIVFDFQAENAFSTAIGKVNKDAGKTLTAPTAISSDNETNLSNSVFGISGLSAQFTKEYFDEHSVNYNVEIIMITNAAFENNPVASNVRYLPESKVWFMNQYFPGLVKKDITIFCASITLKENANQKRYDFNLSADGAENEGNYVYVLVSYGTGNDADGTITETNIANFAYAILKIKINPNDNSIQLYNTDRQYNGIDEDNQQKITYTNGTFQDLKLGTYGASYEENNLIYILGTGTKNLICDETGDNPSSLSLVGEIAKYAELDHIGGTYYLKQKAGTVAIYGDKTGYIKITDMYGYEKKYYLTLKAESEDDALSLVKLDEGSGTFINCIADTKSKFYSGTELTLVDAEQSVSLGQMGAIRVNNLETLQMRVYGTNAADIWKYQVTYKIPELNFEHVNPEFVGTDEPMQTFVLPSISSNSMDITLYIIITITHNDIEEVVTLTTSLTIEKRFKLTDNLDSSSSVQAGINFDVSKYLTVKDEANIGANLGGANISGNVFTLKVDAKAENIGKTITVNAIHSSNQTLNRTGVNIVIGKDFDDQTISAKNGYFYYLLSEHPGLEGIDFSDFTFSVTSSEITVSSNCQFLADKVIYLTTSNIDASKKVYVHINNSAVAFAIPFFLSENGIQAKSLCEVVECGELVTNITHTQATTNLPEIKSCGYENANINNLNAIYEYSLSSTPVNAEDLQTIKNFQIYDDSIKLEISNFNNSLDLTQLQFTVEIRSSDDEFLGSKVYLITETVSHYRYISVYEIIKSVDILETYKVIISYQLPESNIKSIISYNGEIATSGPKVDNQYTYSIQGEFKFNQILAGLTERLDVLTANVFTNRVCYTEKSYVVKYLDQNVYEAKKLNFTVTPKYYGLDNEGFSIDKKVYANQFTVENGIYTVEFNTWTSSFNLVNLAGDVITSLNNDSSLMFKINDGQGTGSGSASLDENGNLVTNQNYNPDQYFVIEVWVPVIEDKEYIFIGSVEVRLIHSHVYVTNLATYMFIITYPNESHTIEPSYTFTNNVTSISDLVFKNPSDQLQNIVNKDTNTITIGGQARSISACNIEIITVIEQIYSAEYVVKNSKEYLELKLKLNETSSSDGKTVELQVNANANATGAAADPKNIKLSIAKQDGEDLVFNISCGENSICTRTSAGVYVVDVPFELIYTNLIGEDFTYAAKVVDTATTNAELLYAKRTQDKSEFNANQTLFFALSFADMDGNNHYSVLATKFDENNVQMFETSGYFTLNISTIPVIDGVTVLTSSQVDGKTTYESTVMCYSIKFLGAYEIDLSASDLLITSIIDDKTNAYSVGKVINYSETNVFEIKINGEEIYNILISSSNKPSLTAYETSNTATIDNFYLPTVVEINVSGLTYFGVYSSVMTDIKLIAVEPTQTDVIDFEINLDWFVSATPYVSIIDLTNKILATTQLAETTYWTQDDASSFVKTTATITNQENYTQYVFNYNMLTNSNTAMQVELFDLSELIASTVAETYYNFSLQKFGNNSSSLYFAVQADVDGKVLVDPTDVLTGALAEDGVYVFTLQNIENVGALESKTIYELYQSEQLYAITAVALTQQGNVYVLDSNLLADGVTFARQVQGNMYNAEIPTAKMTYVTITIGLNTTYTAIYFSQADVYSVDLSSLESGQIAYVNVSTVGGFETFDPQTSSITLITQAQDIDTEFIVSYSGIEVEIVIEVPKGQTSTVIDQTQLGENIVNNLTIRPN